MNFLSDEDYGEQQLKNICPTDTPGPVVNIEASDIQQTSAKLSWSPPEVDGGSEVTHYIVEKRAIDRKTWAVVKGEVEIDKIPFKVGGLTAGTDYYFRVTAVNQYGPGVPKASPTSYLASDPTSTYGLQINTFISFPTFILFGHLHPILSNNLFFICHIYQHETSSAHLSNLYLCSSR